ncbi:MAG TPA: hypothetical protein VK158_06380, partial [Acidobacteriota bacterium]|nr:hypothetical protein [Acidobacteriota bacterium]
MTKSLYNVVKECKNEYNSICEEFPDYPPKIVTAYLASKYKSRTNKIMLPISAVSALAGVASSRVAGVVGNYLRGSSLSSSDEKVLIAGSAVIGLASLGIYLYLRMDDYFLVRFRYFSKKRQEGLKYTTPEQREA